MRLRMTWPHLRDGLAVILAAGFAGILLSTWWTDASWNESSRRLAAIERDLQAAQQKMPGGPAASRQRLAALETELAKLQQATPAQARLRSRQDMQRWLDARAAEVPAAKVGLPFRGMLGLLAFLALALLGLTVGRWLPWRT